MKLPHPTTPPSTNSPPLGTSPPHESKVRQIRKRVKDLSWKEARRRRSGSAGEVDPQDEGPEAGDAASEGKAEEDDSSTSVSAKSESDKEEVERGGGEDGPVIEATAGPPAGASAELSDRVMSADLSEPAVTAESPLGTDDEAKHAETDAAASSIPRVSPDPDACQGKRRRDDGDQNPRETKRISPPPEQEKNDVKPQAVKVVSHSENWKYANILTTLILDWFYGLCFDYITVCCSQECSQRLRVDQSSAEVWDDQHTKTLAISPSSCFNPLQWQCFIRVTLFPSHIRLIRIQRLCFCCITFCHCQPVGSVTIWCCVYFWIQVPFTRGPFEVSRKACECIWTLHYPFWQICCYRFETHKEAETWFQ